MSLPILILLVVTGVPLVIALVHFTGGGRQAEITDEGSARARYAQDYPEDRITGVEILPRRRDAILTLEDGAVGLVHTIGARFLTRRLEHGDVTAVETGASGELTLHFADFTWPATSLGFSGADEAEAARERFAALVGKGD